MKICLIGPRTNLGIGRHFSHFVDNLRRVQSWADSVVEVDCRDPVALQKAADHSGPGDINISFVALPLHDHFQGTNIQWVVFESDRVPDIVQYALKPSDQIWVPSEWGRNVLIAHGFEADRCHVMPEGVDTLLYHPWHPTVPRSVTRFLLVGKFEQRKCVVETMLAWGQAFGQDPGVELVIKTDHFVDQDLKQQQIQQILDDHELHTVKVIWGAVGENQLLDLYRSADVFVLPTRGEGWGLPLIEAAAMGLPIITTQYSGHLEFLRGRESSCVWVEHDMVPVACAEYQRFYPQAGDWGMWAQPRQASLVQALQRARQDLDQLRAQALINSVSLREQFSWPRSVDRVLSLLHSQKKSG